VGSEQLSARHADMPLSTGQERENACLSEEAFCKRIALERKRTERSERPFLLMLLNAADLLETENGGKVLGEILYALSSSVRQTDAIGWYTFNAVLGIVFTEIGIDARKSIASQIYTKVTGALYQRLTFVQFNQIQISSYIFPEDWDNDVSQSPSNPTLYPDLFKPQNGHKLFTITKRAIDLVGSGLGLLVCAPLFLIIALAIKITSPGPIFFRQQRIGQFGKPFLFWKFRSMRVNCDTAVHRKYVKKLISGDMERTSTSGCGQVLYKLTKDVRVTRIGGLLRRASLDELPQLYNVLKGNMSLVGPRPALPYEVENYQVWHRRRVLEAKPGITGLWQVRGRSRVSFNDMVRLDVRYATSRSLWLDMKILIGTPRAVILGDGAY
jgi:lipopolysaccharide/colanic/teichoic acid biosynthesis glycosyltransferase